MIAVDTNLLVYAHREESDWHQEALSLLKQLAEGTSRWAIPWPCVHEFLSVVTHPSVYTPPTPMAVALDAMQVWLGSPSCRALAESSDYFATLKNLALQAKIRGPRIHDARIAAICLENGVAELWSADRDLGRFRQLKVVNPLVRKRGGGE